MVEHRIAVCERFLEWRRQSQVDILAENQIHLWLIPLAELPITFTDGFCDGLTEREFSRAGKILDEGKRRLYSGGRIGLKMLLERYSGISQDELNFGYGERGKPFLKDQVGRPRLEFNYTVSSGFAMYAFSWDRDLGIDLEISPRIIETDLLAKRILTKDELASWNQIPEQKRNIFMLACWTRKEAYGKLLGVGIRYAMNDVDLFVGLHTDSWVSRITGLFEELNSEQRHAVGIQVGLPVPGVASVMFFKDATEENIVGNNVDRSTGSSGIFKPELLGFMYSREQEKLR